MSWDAADALHISDDRVGELTAIIDDIWMAANTVAASAADFYDYVATLLERNGWKLLDYEMMCRLHNTYGIDDLDELAKRAPRFAARLRSTHTPPPHCRCSCGEDEDEDGDGDDCCGCPCHLEGR
ncbi:MAG: hypothetical protein KDB37_17470 [Ilumatobacter sp.]|nr:hypothetical protein [Ilumatobacter sp.]